MQGVMRYLLFYFLLYASPSFSSHIERFGILDGFTPSLYTDVGEDSFVLKCCDYTVVVHPSIDCFFYTPFVNIRRQIFLHRMIILNAFKDALPSLFSSLALQPVHHVRVGKVDILYSGSTPIKSSW